MNKFSEQDVINYADGQMEADEAKAFEEALSRDTALQAGLKLYKSIKGTLQQELAPDKDDADFKATLGQFTQQHFKQKRSKPMAKVLAFSKIWYAAAVLVIGLLIWAPWNNNLYSRYSETEMVSFTERGNDTETLLIEATEAYNAEQYTKAKEILSKLVDEEPDNDMLRYYLGVAQLKSGGNIKAARSNLTLVANKNSLLKYDAVFFMALSYLKEENKEECRVWLKKIPEEAGVYDKAQELLKAL